MMAADVLMLVMCSSLRARGLPFCSSWWRLLLAAANPMSESFNHVEAHRDEENCQERSRQHAADYDRSQHLARYSTSARGSPQRHASQDECEGCHRSEERPVGKESR